MATTDQIRVAIKAKLSAIPDIGRVHGYERYARQDGDFQAHYMAEIGGKKQIRGWYVRRLTRADAFVTIGRRRVATGWQIRGFLAIADSAGSELAFDGLIDRVMDDFAADLTLGGLVQTTVGADGRGMQLEDSQPVLLAGVLCHSARLRFSTWHEI